MIEYPEIEAFRSLLNITSSKVIVASKSTGLTRQTLYKALEGKSSYKTRHKLRVYVQDTISELIKQTNYDVKTGRIRTELSNKNKNK